MKEIAKRAEVAHPTVIRINKATGIRRKGAANIGLTRVSPQTRNKIIVALRQGDSFAKIVREIGTSMPTVARINKILQIQSQQQVLERKSKKSKRYYMFSSEEKWKIIFGMEVGIRRSIFSAANRLGTRSVPVDDLMQEIRLKAFSALDLLPTNDVVIAKKYVGGLAKIVTWEYIRVQTKKSKRELRFSEEP